MKLRLNLSRGTRCHSRNRPPAFSAEDPVPPAARKDLMKKLIVVLLTLAIFSVGAAGSFAYAQKTRPSDAPTVTVTYLRR